MWLDHESLLENHPLRRIAPTFANRTPTILSSQKNKIQKVVCRKHVNQAETAPSLATLLKLQIHQGWVKAERERERVSQTDPRRGDPTWPVLSSHGGWHRRMTKNNIIMLFCPPYDLGTRMQRALGQLFTTKLDPHKLGIGKKNL